MYMLSLTRADDLTMPLFNGLTFIHSAVTGKEMSLIDALMRRGLDFDARNDWGTTPLAYAVRECSRDVVRFLLGLYQARGRDEHDVLRELVEQTGEMRTANLGPCYSNPFTITASGTLPMRNTGMRWYFSCRKQAQTCIHCYWNWKQRRKQRQQPAA